MSYDSESETRQHIARVRELLMQVVDDLTKRGWKHDASKLVEPEKSMFDKHTPRLRALEYDSPEYRAELEAMGPALQHHYAENDHHPQHHQCGIEDMNLVQFIEMLADWKAAGERHASGGDLRASIVANAERFGYGEEIERLLLNTAEDLGWM